MGRGNTLGANEGLAGRGVFSRGLLFLGFRG